MDSRLLDDLAASVVADEVAPAAVAGLARRRGREWELSLGSAGCAPDAFFDLASLTKPMTALAIARAGGIRSAPLEALVPEAAATPTASIPVEMLLAHRAGLEAHMPLFRAEPYDPQIALSTAARSRRPEIPPGAPLPAEGFPPIYSDMGYLLAGEALRRRAGHADAGGAIDALVVAPLELGAELGTARLLRERVPRFDRDVLPTEIVPERGGAVRGAVHDENAWAYAMDAGCGHAGMFGTTSAVLRFGAAALDAIARAEGPLAKAGEDFGWLVRERPGGTLRAGFDGKSADGASSAGEKTSARTFGHLGFTGTSVWIDPDAEVVLVLLTNRVHPTRDNVRIRTARPRIHDALFDVARGDRL